MATTKQQGIITKNAAEKSKDPAAELRTLVQKMSPAIAKALPSVVTPERFTRIALTAISSTPKLAACSHQSFLGALMQAAQLGLEPNTPLGQAYLIPYNSYKEGMQCQFQIGYKGLLDLAHRSGQISTIGAYVVHENDEFEYTYGLEPTLVHKPALTARGKPIAYYAIYKTKDGGFGFEVMNREDVEKHAQKYSKTYTRGPWQDQFDEMAKKTVLKKVLKYAPMKSDFVRALEADNTTAVIKDLGNPNDDLDIVYQTEAEEIDDTFASEDMQSDEGTSAESSNSN